MRYFVTGIVVALALAIPSTSLAQTQLLKIPNPAYAAFVRASNSAAKQQGWKITKCAISADREAAACIISGGGVIKYFGFARVKTCSYYLGLFGTNKILSKQLINRCF